MKMMEKSSFPLLSQITIWLHIIAIRHFPQNFAALRIEAPLRNYHLVLIAVLHVDKSWKRFLSKILPSVSICFGSDRKKHTSYLHKTSSAINTNYWNDVKKNLLLIQPQRVKQEQRIAHAPKQQIVSSCLCSKAFCSKNIITDRK